MAGGKTQLLKLIAGIVRLPSASYPALRYRLDGEWHRVPYEVKERIAYVGPERQDKYQRYDWNISAADVVGTGVHGSDIPLIALSTAERQRVRVVLESSASPHSPRAPFLSSRMGSGAWCSSPVRLPRVPHCSSSMRSLPAWMRPTATA